MNISGTASMHAPAGQVWAALTDPVVLASTIPGCEQLDRAGPASCRFRVTAAVAAIQGSFAGEASLSEQHAPVSFVLAARGAGDPGSVAATVQVTLTPGADGITELAYDADASIGGMIAGVGQRMLASIASRLAGEFLSSVDQVLTRNGAVPADLVPAARPAAAPQPMADPAGRPAFLRGIIIGGAAGALAGVVAGRLIGRRER